MKNTQPINNYKICAIRCSYSYKISSHIDIFFNDKIYNVEVSKGICLNIEKGNIKPKFYYMKEKDLIFYENQYIPFPYIYLTYILSIFFTFIRFHHL
jgi:hypothetical protein